MKKNELLEFKNTIVKLLSEKNKDCFLKKIYSMIKDELKGIKNIKLGLGAEVPELWDELGIEKTSVHCNVVHQHNKNKVKSKK